MVTLKKIAQELDLSISTVSKALNNSYEISEKTISRVKELASFYNYRPNKTALSLKSNKTKTIGVIIPDILNRFLAKVLYGIEREANKKGYDIITCISNESLEKEKQSMELLANGSVDGFIIAVSQETQQKNVSNHFDEILNQGYPIVMFDRVLSDVLCDKVTNNNFASTYDITKQLIAAKKSKIAFISSISELKISGLREGGYDSAIEEHNLDKLVLRIKKGDDKQTTLKSFLEQHPDIDAIISADNNLGTIAINVTLNLGYKVPEDISVVGFSSESVADYSIPKLTIIKQHAKEMGRKTVSLLVNKLQDKANNKTEVVTVKTSLVRKGSF